jgi:hypothetical protein
MNWKILDKYLKYERFATLIKMLQSVFVMFLVFSQSFQFLKAPIGHLKDDRCATNNDNFFTTYEKHFSLVNFLTITILQTDKYKQEVNELVEEFLKLLKSSEFANYGIRIEEKFFTGSTKNRRSRRYAKFPRSEETGGSTFHADGTEDVVKAKKLTTSSGKGYMIIVWNPDVLGDFLDTYGTVVVPKPSATYALLFAFPSYNCKVLANQMHHTLRHFWTNHNILDVIAQAPCSCASDQIYIYRPFVKVKNSWGATQNYTAKQVQNNSHLIANTLSNLNRFPLRIALFEKSPTAIKVLPKLLRANPIYKNLSWSKGFAGSDALLLGTIAEHLNFDPIVDKMPPFNFGNVFPNGTITGVIAMVINKQSDFGVNCRLMSYYPVDGFAYTVPYSSDKISIAVPKAAKVPRWHSLFACFDKLSWILILVASVLCCVFWYFIRNSSFAKTVWEMYSFLMGIPYKVVPSTGQIFFLTSSMIFNVVVLGIVQGSLFKAFTTTTFYPDVDTLEDVVESGLPIMAFSWFIVRGENSSVIKKLKERSMPITDDRFDLMAYQRNIAAIDRRLDLEIQIKTKYLASDGVPLLHIVSENLASLHTTSIVPSDSPYLIAFNKIIRRVFEGGLTSKWYNDVVDSMFIESVMKMLNHQEFKSFSLADIQTAFYVIGCGYIASTILFLCEFFSKYKYVL